MKYREIDDLLVIMRKYHSYAVKEKLEREKSAELEELLIPVVNPSNNQQFVQKTKVLL